MCKAISTGPAKRSRCSVKRGSHHCSPPVCLGGTGKTSHGRRGPCGLDARRCSRQRASPSGGRREGAALLGAAEQQRPSFWHEPRSLLLAAFASLMGQGGEAAPPPRPCPVTRPSLAPCSRLWYLFNRVPFGHRDRGQTQRCQPPTPLGAHTSAWSHPSHPICLRMHFLPTWSLPLFCSYDAE